MPIVIPGMAYASVNDLQPDHEIRGSGRPFVLLHSGLHAELAVLPGATHVGVTQRPSEKLALITPFLDAR